jgi:hypothetical protein
LVKLRKGRVVVGGNPYSYSDYYTSNRVFFEVASGIPTVEILTPRFDNILRDNDHVYFAKNVDDVIAKCEELLKLEPEVLYEKASKAAKYIEEKHTQYHIMKFILETSLNYMKERNIFNIQLPFFLSEVDLETEKKFAIRKGL